VPKILALCMTLGASMTGLLTADEIPGWTDLTNVAKVSIIGFLCALVGLTLLMLLMLLRNQQKDFIAEVQASRHDYGVVIKDIRQVITNHLESQSQTISGLAIQCAKNQTQSHVDSERRHTDAVQAHDDLTDKHTDAVQAHDDLTDKHTDAVQAHDDHLQSHKDQG
jgi:hypothetical protein